MWPTYVHVLIYTKIRILEKVIFYCLFASIGYKNSGFEIHLQQPGQNLAPGHPEKAHIQGYLVHSWAIFINVYFCIFYQVCNNEHSQF